MRRGTHPCIQPAIQPACVLLLPLQVMEYADRGDLLEYLRRRGRFREHEARWFFQQLVFGLDYCHQRGVYNRDIKPENLLLKRTPDARQVCVGWGRPLGGGRGWRACRWGLGRAGSAEH